MKLADYIGETTAYDKKLMLELNRLVLKGSCRSWDSLPSVYKRKDFSFEVLYATYHEKTKLSFEESDFQSFGLVTDDGHLTIATHKILGRIQKRQQTTGIFIIIKRLHEAMCLVETVPTCTKDPRMPHGRLVGKECPGIRRTMWRKTPDSRID